MPMKHMTKAVALQRATACVPAHMRAGLVNKTAAELAALAGKAAAAMAACGWVEPTGLPGDHTAPRPGHRVVRLVGLLWEVSFYHDGCPAAVVLHCPEGD